MKGGWSIRVKGLSSTTLMELYQLLKGSAGNRVQALEVQAELIARAGAEGLTTQEIVKALVAGVGKKSDRGEIAKEWYPALGITEREARRLAG